MMPLYSTTGFMAEPFSSDRLISNPDMVDFPRVRLYLYGMVTFFFLKKKRSLDFHRFIQQVNDGKFWPSLSTKRSSGVIKLSRLSGFCIARGTGG